MYAEAYVNVNQYDIVLDVLIVNQTKDTLQNCTLELATLGDLKLVEKPQVSRMAFVQSLSVKGTRKFPFNLEVIRVFDAFLPCMPASFRDYF